MAHLRSSRYRLKYSGAAFRAYRAAPAHCPSLALRITLPAKTSPAKTFFLPRVAMHVVPVPFPKSSLVAIQKFQAGDPFRALPGVQLRHDQPGRPAMLFGQRLAIVQEG